MRSEEESSLRTKCPPGRRIVRMLPSVRGRWDVAWITLVPSTTSKECGQKPCSAGCFSPSYSANSTKGKAVAKRCLALRRKALDRSVKTYCVAQGLSCGSTDALVAPVPAPTSRIFRSFLWPSRIRCQPPQPCSSWLGLAGASAGLLASAAMSWIWPMQSCVKASASASPNSLKMSRASLAAFRAPRLSPLRMRALERVFSAPALMAFSPSFSKSLAAMEAAREASPPSSWSTCASATVSRAMASPLRLPSSRKALSASLAASRAGPVIRRSIRACARRCSALASSTADPASRTSASMSCAARRARWPPTPPRFARPASTMAFSAMSSPRLSPSSLQSLAASLASFWPSMTSPISACSAASSSNASASFLPSPVFWKSCRTSWAAFSAFSFSSFARWALMVVCSTPSSPGTSSISRKSSFADAASCSAFCGFSAMR
mmetsp:Transcript_99712/g.310054  ORF Transcript_99712/g.310054 Transcript_99712/m.310054 type:complete len:436 (+) Transcript_99712:299-1606(+)